MKRPSRCRLKVLASHPIQYFTPIYRILAARRDLDLEVLYCRDFGVKARFDRQFEQRIRWDTDQLSGYAHRFLWNASPISDTFNPLHAINPGAFTRVLSNADAVWMNGYMYPSNWFALAAAGLGRVSVLSRSEIWLDPDRATRHFDRMRDRVIRWWVRRSDALLYIGQNNREAYLHYGADPSSLFFSPYSVDVEAIEACRLRRSERNETRRSWRLNGDRLVVLFVGKLTERKHPEAVMNLANTPELRDRIHVVLAGSGPLSSALRARCTSQGIENVTFLGFVNQSELPSVYAAADVFVMPSEREPWGLVLNEAMAAGLVPVVSDAVGAAADLINDQVTGFAFPSGEWHALQRIVARVVSDGRLRDFISRNARARAREYSHEAAANGVVEGLLALGHLAAPPVRKESVKTVQE